MKNLVLRNIFGRKVKLNIPTTEENEETREVVKVATLPATGEEGKLYYNTTDKKWYNYNSTDGFKPVGGEAIISAASLPASGEEGKLYYDTTTKKWYTYNGEEYVPVGNDAFEIVRTDAREIDAVKNKLYITSSDGATGEDENRTYTFFLNLTDVKPVTVGLQTSYPADGPYLMRFTCANEATSITVRIPVPTGREGEVNYITVPIADNAPDFEVDHTYEVNVLADIVSIYDVTPADGE